MKKLLRWHITIWCTSLFQCDKLWKILDAKAAVDKEWTKLKTIPAWQLDRVKSKKEVIDEARRDKNNVHSATLMDVCHLEKWGVSTRITEVQRQSRALGDIVKYGPGAYAFFWEQGSSASQMIAAKIMDVSARLPACDGQTVGAVSAYTQVKLEDAPRLLAKHS